MQLFLLFLSLLLSTEATSQTTMTNKGATIQLNHNSIMAINGSLLNQSTGIVAMNNGSQLYIKGDLSNNALTNFTTGTGGNIVFNGNNRQTIGGSQSVRFYQLESANSSGDIQLDTNIQIDHSLTMTNGNIDLNGQVMNLTATATILNETNNSRILGTSGFIRTTRLLNAPSHLNIGGLGLTIDATANFGTTTIERGHQQQTTANGTSILRYYNVYPTNNSGLNASIQFNYLDNELAGSNESGLQLSQSINNGTSWTTLGGTVYSNSNYLEFSGINAFNTRLTLNNTFIQLPIEGLNFQVALIAPKTVQLDWSTATELNNAYFEVQRSTDGIHFEFINRIAGFGTSYEQQAYTDWDYSPPSGHVYYRLKQVNLDQTYSFSPIRHVYIKENNTHSIALYPNPLLLPQALQINVQQIGTYTITLYKETGAIVFTKQWQNNNTNNNYQVQLPNLSAANYFYTLHHETSLITQGKLILLHH